MRPRPSDEGQRMTDGDRLEAHERPATGALARWVRICATHPWRIVGGWVGIIVVLIVLVGTIGGSPRDEVDIPGSDAPKATHPLEAPVTSRQGGGPKPGFPPPAGPPPRPP